MTSSGGEDHPAVPAPPDPPTTGVGAVDGALRGLDGVEERPLPERVAAFEQAHAALRGALEPADDDEGAGEQPGPA